MSSTPGASSAAWTAASTYCSGLVNCSADWRHGLRRSRVRSLLTVFGAALAVSVAGIATVQGPGAIGPSIRAFFDGVAGDRFAIGATASTFVPILLCGLGASIAFRAGLFDVGQPAQLVIGALAAGAVAPVLPG